jgi:hypothetical protein
MNPNPEVTTTARANAATSHDSNARITALWAPLTFNPPLMGPRKKSIGMRYADDPMRNVETEGLSTLAVSGEM